MNLGVKKLNTTLILWLFSTSRSGLPYVSAVGIERSIYGFKNVIPGRKMRIL